MSSFFSSGGTGVGTFIVPEMTSDPTNPVVGQAWVLKTIYPLAGVPIGLSLLLTYAYDNITYQLSYFTMSHTIIRVSLN